MPAPCTADEFLDLVQKSCLVDNKRLSAHLNQMRAAGALPHEPAKVANLLIRDGLLTNFQAEKLLLGRWRGFIIGNYKILEHLGSGGMAGVFLCENQSTNRRVAVKVPLPPWSNDPSSLERFYRGARALAALNHTNIVRAYDIGQDNNLHFLVMEYVDGSSLHSITEKCGPMDVLRAAHYMSQAAFGLQHAHEAGFVHRDIKPAHILLNRLGVVKIIDMGLVLFYQEKKTVPTPRYARVFLGTPDYIAPEQALDSQSVDIRADIYSLGATFYFCLTRCTPFHGGTIAQKLIWNQTRQPKPIRQLRPEVSEGLAALIERMTAKDPAQRPQTPQEVADALAPYTAEPIGPPPEDEMPRLCPAASGCQSPSTASLPGS
jgi:serine/threonine protein kinase